MFKRLINLIKSWFGAGIEQLENPELLLTQAQEEMRAVHAKNRERAVQAITQKNNLQQMVNDLQKTVDNLQAKAELALKRGDRELALNLLKEKQSYEQSLTMTRSQLEQAIETSEQVKAAIKREEERIRQKTAEALALKAQWKNSQIQIAMSKALDGMQGIESTESAFANAQRKIQSANSEMQARVELGKTRVESRLRELEINEADVAAENELSQLEAKMGIGSQSTVARPTTTVADNSVESELARLEAKISGSGS
ncbi:MAG: PspA/IM30 family protein [Capsulimonadales bacterium]|nr:PspA/IM30 family protein [Capsulimonadales bacterium]